ncbi:MAG: nitrate ABC transporter ATP-binding protein, partial [Chloroflexi bacterium]|nr:nitrate ABC transporter ATP-binding protein [Chloroflexota bacterium]
AMAIEPELLCLDEPFSALDVLSAESLRGELMELWTEGKIPTRAILMVSHNIEEAVFMGDRLIIMDKNPGRVISQMAIDLPHARQRKSARFLEFVDLVYGILAGQTLPEEAELGSSPGRPGLKRWLPDVHVSDLIGLLEHLGEKSEDINDIYQLADDLSIDSDRLLQLIEAAELLGFATVAKGDISLTPLGEAFSDASIQTRKEIFATRIRRLPIFRWLLDMLRRAEERTLNGQVVQAALELELPPPEAEKQLDILVAWGRYGEVLAYEDEKRMVTLELAGSTGDRHYHART